MYFDNTKQLIGDYLKGNQRAFFQITSWITPIVKSDYWGLREHWDDIIQDVRIKIYLNLKQKKFRYQSNLKTYVCRIAKNTCIDYLRKSYLLERTNIDSNSLDEKNDQLSSLIQKEDQEIIHHIFQKLPEMCRQVLQMVFIDSLPYKKISKLLGVAEGTVKSRVSRCIHKANQLHEIFSH